MGLFLFVQNLLVVKQNDCSYNKGNKKEEEVFKVPDIRAEELIYFENQLYLPMLIKVLEKDIDQINKQPLKLKRPYLKIVESAIEMIHKDLKTSEMYLLRNSMKVYKWKKDNDSTTYVFQSKGVEDHRKLLNVEIKEKCEELLGAYLVH